MAIYRALRDLGIGNRVVKKGDIFPGAWLKPSAIEKLTQMGHMSIAVLPPISAIPSHKSKAKKLEKIDVMDAGQFLETPDDVLAAALKEPEVNIRAMKNEFYRMFSIPRRRS